MTERWIVENVVVNTSRTIERIAVAMTISASVNPSSALRFAAGRLGASMAVDSPPVGAAVY